MGKTNRLGPRASAPGDEEARSNWKLALSADFPKQPMNVRGSDLYRLNCQGCHRQSGVGAPPEINSIVSPVRATSAVLVLERMRNMGIEVSRRDATQLAKESQRALWQRLHAGGQDMPGFGYLSAPESEALVAYLREMAGIPRAEQEQRSLRESPLRVGELIVKSTCHICHGAAGTNPGSEQLAAGAIPPLATLTTRVNLAGFVRKVTVGAPLVIGDPAISRRGRMPVFDYLSQTEPADVYLYLTLYPPADVGLSNPDITLAEASPTVAGALLPSSSASSRLSLRNREAFDQKQTDDWVPRLLMLGTVWFAAQLLAGGVALTLSEFRRLSVESRRPRPAIQMIRPEKDERSIRAVI